MDIFSSIHDWSQYKGQLWCCYSYMQNSFFKDNPWLFSQRDALNSLQSRNVSLKILFTKAFPPSHGNKWLFVNVVRVLHFIQLSIDFWYWPTWYHEDRIQVLVDPFLVRSKVHSKESNRTQLNLRLLFLIIGDCTRNSHRYKRNVHYEIILFSHKIRCI